MTTIRSLYTSRTRRGLDFKGQISRTKQSFRDETDVNLILAKYTKTGALPDTIKRDPTFGDFSNVPCYQEALNCVTRAHEQFSQLPAHVRKRFENDPKEFLAFASDHKNLQEMVDLGLASIAPDQNVPKSSPKKQDPEPDPTPRRQAKPASDT